MPVAILAALSVAPATLRLMFGGDVMLNGIAPGPSVFAGIIPTLRSADVAFANLEVPLTRSTARTSRKSASELRQKNQWILKAWPEHAPYLRAAGIRMVSLGNNHAMDFGGAGIREMRKLLSDNRILCCGAGENANAANRLAVYCDPYGHRIGMLSVLAFMSPPALKKCTPATLTAPGVAVLSFGGRLDTAARTKLSRWIAHAKSSCDKLVVAVHWGTERKSLPNPYQVTLGRALADAGADVVWGNHPHVLQGAEIYKDVPILYSMGNLISSSSGTTGLVQIQYRGRRPTLDFFPARIRGCRVAATPAQDALSERIQFAELCTQIQRKYPNPYSCAPGLRLFTTTTAHPSFPSTVTPQHPNTLPPAILGHGRGRALHRRGRQIQPPHEPVSGKAHVLRWLRRRNLRGRVLHLRSRRHQVSRLPRRIRHLQPRPPAPESP